VASNHGWGNAAQAFGNRNYRTYQLGRFVSQIMVWQYRVAIGWLVWELTHSATWLGIFGFLDQSLALFIMPIAGALADRTDSLKYLRVTQALLLIQAVVLSLLDAFDVLNLWILVAFTLSNGAINSAQQPASQAILPNLLRKEELATGYGLNSMTFNVSRFIGPMIAGIVIVNWGTAPAIFCNAIGAATFSFCLFSMRNNFTFPARPRNRSAHMAGDLRGGLKYAVRHKGIGPTMAILSALAIMPFTIDPLLPSLADGVFHAGATGLSWMTSTMGVGALVQGSLIVRRGGIAGLSAYVNRAILCLGIAFLVLSLSGYLWLALVCIFVIGFSSSATRVASMTLLQFSVDVDMRGRVASFYGVINQAGPALASLAVGALCDRFGIPLIMGIVGACTLGVWSWAVARHRAIATALEVEPLAHRSVEK